jgi:RAT1-interacting protein
MDEVKFERKLCRMWAQSFLLGVPKLIVGFRSRNGILQSTSEFRVRDIPGIVKRRRQSWDGNLAIKFMEFVLHCRSIPSTSDGDSETDT